MKNSMWIVSAVCMTWCSPWQVPGIVAADEKAASAGSNEDSTAAAVTDEIAETERLSKLIEVSVDDYQLFADENSSAELLARPVLRWRNAARGQDGEAMFVVWLQDGHPLAMASIYPWQGNLIHEFDLLCRKPGLVAKSEKGLVWSPLSAGVNFKTVPGAKAPGNSAVARIREMKLIAERFEGTMTGWNATDSDIEKLRLMPRPLYRYDGSRDVSADRDPFDGGLFSFATGTDPEIVLILEAVTTGNTTEWEYACVRATSGGLEMRLDGTVVWNAVKYPEQSARSHHFSARVPVPTTAGDR